MFEVLNNLRTVTIMYQISARAMLIILFSMYLIGEPVDQEEGRGHVKRDVPGHVRGDDQDHLLERRKNLDHGHYQYLSFDEQILSCLGKKFL